jgi:coenzyme PQQ precursor peptide PqqA
MCLERSIRMTKPWEKPEGEEVSVSAECTAYSGSR